MLCSTQRLLLSVVYTVTQRHPVLWQVKCGFTSAPASQYEHVHKNEAPPDVIDPGMPTEGGVESNDVAPRDHEETAPREIQDEVTNEPSESTMRTTHELQEEDKPSENAIESKREQPQHTTSTRYFEVHTTLERRSRITCSVRRGIRVRGAST
jgi:hypothetical protein